MCLEEVRGRGTKENPRVLLVRKTQILDRGQLLCQIPFL